MKLIYRGLGLFLTVFTLIMLIWGLCFAFSWIGLEKAKLFVTVLFFWFGLYFFNATKPLEGESRILKKVVHILTLPLAVLGYLTFKGTLNPVDFWPVINMAMLAIGSYGIILLAGKSGMSIYIKWFISFYIFVLLVLTILHMQGNFENGKLLSLLVFCGFGIQLAMIMMSRKEV
jgi:hypothetical protein